MQLKKSIKNQTTKKLVFIGFMGSGKTTISRQISKLANLNLYNVDEIIEANEGKSIKEIFLRHGEEKFRDAETKVIRNLVTNSHGIIDCGGGVINRVENMEILRLWGKIIWLYCPLEISIARTATSSRPLLQNKSRKQISDIYKTREMLYQRHSDYKINTGRDKKIIIKDIMEIIS